MQVVIEDQRIVAGGQVRMGFHRTLRIPTDGRNYPLPPGLGMFPIKAVKDYPNVPDRWASQNAFFIPMYQREAMWIGFENEWPPVAIKVAVGTVNAISGRAAGEDSGLERQDYVVCPQQLWLDGINAGPDMVRQFVAMPLGQGYTVEGAIIGSEEHGGIQLSVAQPKPGVVLKRPTREQTPVAARTPRKGMGLGAGGQIAQKIYVDPYGVDIWDMASATPIVVYIVNSDEYRDVTGAEPPPTPIDAATYTAANLPWFVLYEEHQKDVPAPESLTRARTVAERDRELGLGGNEDPVNIDVRQVTPLDPEPKQH